MQIEIEYEASWRNSFLDGDNNQALPRNGRKYIASFSGLKDRENVTFIKRKVTLNTVMGVLNRLIGDQKKLYQARESKDYYFGGIESKITFNDKIKELSNEIVYLRNMSGNYDRESFIGAIDINHTLISANYSKELWSVLDLTLSEIIIFILEKKVHNISSDEINPLRIKEILSTLKDIKINKLKDDIDYDKLIKSIEYLQKNKKINLEIKNKFPKLQKTFSDIEYIKNDKVVIRALYCSALYLQAIEILNKYDIKDIYLKGISVNGFTAKDFMSLFTGGKKRVYGNPYRKEEKIKGKGDVVSMLNKANGLLEITLDISREKAKELKYIIENAGVSSFYLGKKGLAYVTKIDTREVS